MIRTNSITITDLLGVLVLVAGVSSASAATEWTMDLSAEMEGITANLIYGINGSATDGYDDGLDTNAPLADPSGFDAYFNEPGASTGKLNANIKALGATKDWTLIVVAPATKTVDVSWTSGDILSNVDIQMQELDLNTGEPTGTAIDMKAQEVIALTGGAFAATTKAYTVTATTSEPETTTYYRDADGDMYGNASDFIKADSAPEGYVEDNTDCDDNNADVNPGADEICGNEIDDNCDGQVDEGCDVPTPTEWTMDLSAEMEGITANLIYGINGSATDGYDDGLDTNAPLADPSGFDAYFNEPGASTGKLNANIKALGATKDWTLIVVAPATKTVDVSWTSGDILSNVDILMQELDLNTGEPTGTAIDMKAQDVIALTGGAFAATTKAYTVTATTTSKADTTPPVITDVVYATLTTDSVNITWTTDEVGDSLVKYGTETGVYTDNESDTTMMTSHSIALTGLDANTTYYFVVNSTDSSDNSNESAEYGFTTAAAQEDTTPPVITDVVYDTLTTDSVNITWTTDEDSGSLVKYGTVSGTYTVTVALPDAAMTASHSIALTGLDANTTYYFVVNSTDSSDNSNESAEYGFTTAAQEDTTPPEIVSVVLDPTDVAPNDPIKVTVTVTDDMSGVASVTANNETLTLVNGTWEGVIKAESTYGVYNVTVVATDNSTNSNNVTDDSATYTVKEPVPPVVTISIEDVAIRRGEDMTVPITVFDVVNMSGCEIKFTYDPTVVYVTDVTRGDLNFSFEYNINNGSGWMRANALDVDGLSGDVIFAYVTLAAVGNKSDTSEMEFEDSRLIDAYTNIAHVRDNGTFSILPNVLPEVMNVSATPATILYDNGRPRTPGTNTTSLSAQVTDTDGNITAVTINLSSIGGSPAQPMEHVSGALWAVTTNATEVDINAPDFTHQLDIIATDDDGGINDSVSIELTVLKRGDVNGDGLVNKMDADYISRYLAGLEPETSNPPAVLVGDVTGEDGCPMGDGVVDLMDALYIARYTSNMEEEP